MRVIIDPSIDLIYPLNFVAFLSHASQLFLLVTNYRGSDKTHGASETIMRSSKDKWALLFISIGMAMVNKTRADSLDPHNLDKDILCGGINPCFKQVLRFFAGLCSNVCTVS